MIAGNHDTPRSTETGTILRLYEALGVPVVIEAQQILPVSKCDCSVLAAPHQALAQPDRPALRPQRGTTFHVLLVHGQLAGLGEQRGIMEYGGAPVQLEDLAPAQWDYVALGHYHVAREIEKNAWYAGSLEYVAPNPWGQLQDEEEYGARGKGYLLVHLPGSRVEFRPVDQTREHIDLPSIDGKGLTPKQLDERIAAHVTAVKPAIDGQIRRRLVYDLSRATARELDHAAIRGYKARALHSQLDLRRPEALRDETAGGPLAQRQTLPETAHTFSSIGRTKAISTR